jgi:hypothetical protein
MKSVQDQVLDIFWDAGCIIDNRVKGDAWRIEDLMRPVPTFEEMEEEFVLLLEERACARRARRREHWMALWSFVAQPTIFKDNGWSWWSAGVYLRTLISLLIGLERFTRAKEYEAVEVTLVWVAGRGRTWCTVQGPEYGFGYEILTDSQ